MQHKGATQKKEKRRLTAQDAGMEYLKFRSRTAYEMEVYLKGKGYEEEEIGECMDFLTEYHLIDDGAYCLRYIEYAMEKGRGPLRIRRELSFKGVGSQEIDLGLETLFPAETERKMAEKQARNMWDINDVQGTGEERFKAREKTLGRIGRKLASLGYEASVIYSVLRQMQD